ncbi:hypothetical protein OPV22_028101 [Ensete ventricosum]|uniref:Uncharacterized protein n=1 Tax=Ensete ventricosum TaxID=4639 RepID=A0AAV8Q9K1_ENSVE|nr:hypothetical protein OPV22_028101 [Ensete ventricosum]
MAKITSSRNFSPANELDPKPICLNRFHRHPADSLGRSRAFRSRLSPLVGSDSGGERMPGGRVPKPLRVLGTATAFFFGGLFTLSLASSVAMRSLRSLAEAKRKKVALPCAACKGKGFYGCKKQNPEMLELSWEGLCMIHPMLL